MFEHELNQAQREAVENLEGPMLVIAGAGSGKTRVIEYRVRHMVARGIDPASILLLTFTRRAASEMLSRAAKHDPRCQRIEGGTFHSFGYRMLKQYAKAIQFPESFSLLDQTDAEDAIKRCAEELNFFGRDKRAPKKDTLHTILSASLNKDLSVALILENEYPHFIEFAERIEALGKKYVQFKRAMRYVDYDDLLFYCARILSVSEIRSEVGSRYQYVMVDEYQDTNKLQGDITERLGSIHRNVMIVGDDAQSIYGFRGASHENIMGFPQRFPGCKIVKLEENYRSTQHILDLANGVLEDMQSRYAKCLVSANGEAGKKPQLLFFQDPFGEADWVTSAVKFFSGNISLSKQAVLFRSAYISIPLQAALRRAGIPYQVFGGMKFSETAHAKDVVAHLKVLAHPGDLISWARVLILIHGIGPKIASRISEEITRSGGVREKVGEALEFFGREYEGVKRLATFMQSAQNENAPTPSAQFQSILEYYRPILEEKFDDWHTRLNDLNTLAELAADYQSLENLIADLTLEIPETIAGNSKDMLTLSTIHSAKGLEWEHVFLQGVADGVLPVGHALYDREAIEEERRLFYVAVTRAKTQLFLLFHHQSARGGGLQNVSRFLETANVSERFDTQELYRSMAGAGRSLLPSSVRDETDEVIQYDAVPVISAASVNKKRKPGLNFDAIFS